jgi:hypothetical protein
MLLHEIIWCIFQPKFQSLQGCVFVFQIKNECLTCRHGVSVFNMSYFGKFYLTGPDAKKAADWLFSADVNKIPGESSCTTTTECLHSKECAHTHTPTHTAGPWIMEPSSTQWGRRGDAGLFKLQMSFEVQSNPFVPTHILWPDTHPLAHAACEHWNIVALISLSHSERS